MGEQHHTKTTVIFDFDGTLVDVLSIFVNVTNDLAKEYRYAPIQPEEINTLRNFSARELIHSRLHVPFWRLWVFARKARAGYKERLDEVRLFPGIKDTIDSLRESGYRIGIVSSNTTENITAYMKQSGISVDFIYTGNIFGKSRTLDKALSKEHLDPAEVIYVGDEVRDVEACQKCNLDIIAVTWGLNSQTVLQNTGATTVDTQAALLHQLLSYRT
jgi:phosphoglycolate phosphatase-like HAD superfamily hydrolase